MGRPPSRPDFEHLFAAAPVPLMVLAPDPPRFTVLAATDAYLRAVMKRRDELVGRPVFEALPVGPEDTSAEQNSRASFERAIATKAPDAMAVQRHDLERPAAEGGGFEAHYWSPVNTPVLDDAGEVVCIIHRVEDVTEFVRAREQGAEQAAIAEALKTRMGAMEADVYRRAKELQDVNRQLRDANVKLAELDRAKTAFFSNVSHEFRTPLTLILGELEVLLARADVAARAHEELATAHRNALRLLRLVNALLDFSRLEAGRMQARYQPTDLASFTSFLASGFESAAERAGLALRVDCPPLGRPVVVDRGMWEKIVLNLLSNALKFTLAGEIEVRVRAVDDGCELTVRDTGVGIPEAERPRVFERFHRIEGAGGRSSEGTGIGLALVKELVQLHGGAVRVESRVGEGSAFTVRVPFGTAHLPADRIVDAEAGTPTKRGAWNEYVGEAMGWLQPADAGAAPASREPGPVGEARARVLVADDNADMRAYLRRVLETRFEVEVVADGAQALEAARAHPPDLVLSDVMMPRLDGFGLLAEVRADPRLRAVPVVLVSARAGEEAAGEGLEKGADDYLMKPFSARELLARVSANLRLASARAEIERGVGRERALEEIDRRKNEFLAMLSHELRNPLAPIRNSLYVLDRAPPGGEQSRRAQRVIERQVAHLTRMLEDLLDVSRITQGKMHLQKERLALDELVRAVCDDERPELERAGVAFAVHLDDAPLFVDGDPTRLAQVVSNVLRNATKFTPHGGHVELSLRADGRDAAILRVRDDGVGLSSEVLAHLFQPFVQAPQTVERSAGGLGLGLAVVDGLVRLHGGAVDARSEGEGKGTEITIRLPLCEPVQPRSAPPTTPRRERGRRVLIIEDNPDIAESLKEALQLGGHDVDLASDGLAGVERSRALHPDAIVCDIGLPKLDGYGVARAIRADPALRGVCLVAVTGYAAFDDVERARQAGFDHHMAKPTDVDALERILEGCRGASDPR